METIFLNNTTLELNKFFLNKIYDFLLLLEDEYPLFKEWYFKKVLSNDYTLDDRSIILKIYKKEIAAVSIIKHSEDKICTFRVNDKFQGLFIGTQLMWETIKIIKNDKPLITVSEDRLEQFSSILRNFDFKLYGIYESYYIKGKKEYSYNKPIEESTNRIYVPEIVY